MNFEMVNSRLSQLPMVLSGIFFRGFLLREKSVQFTLYKFNYFEKMPTLTSSGL
ncbi:hypothetical protein [Paenibacillus sp. Marseille-Q4541]|uniref:hypothetical protein n=1 Tax=Paenibacillus sp. Marseille-Q4541 TaxID=2831522 RepID=UPI001BA802CD|nr:hypothetical protein [Paenibacillus sp. Marseille-Q4541]